MNHCFISYSTADGLDFTRRLADELESSDPQILAWYDKRDIPPGSEWDGQIVEAIKTCKCMLFVMSEDSTKPSSDCKNEIVFALRYKKPIVPLLLNKNAEPIFVLGTREWIDFTDNFKMGMSKLRKHIREMELPEGILRTLNERLADAEHDLRHVQGEETNRIKVDVEELKTQIQVQEKIVANPKAAQEQTQKNIEAGLERERQPEKPVASKTSTKFINPPPGIAPNYFQDHYDETKQIVDFLNEDSQRLMTIVGRGGVGKTAMVCRLLKGLEGGELPDGLGNMRVEGIVYLSESGSHRVNFVNLFYDLCKLLPSETSQELDAVYKNPQGSTESKMRALLEKFSGGRVVLLLDNFEPLVDTETFAIRDAELDEALRAFLNGTHTTVNIVLTTRVAPRTLNLIQPGRQRVLTLDEGLESPYAENILREMDSDGRMGLKSAPADLLSRARERTRGYPRALEALFAILASDRYTTLDELLAMPTPENVVEALVGEAFNRLDTSAQKVMQALAVYNRPVTPAAVDFLLAPHIPAMDSAPILQRLANMHFARKESGRFYLHPVDREFAFGLIPERDLTTKDTKVTKVTKEKQKKSTAKTAKPAKEDLELLFESSRSWRALRFDAFTQHDLLSRAADYFAQARKPRAEWKKLDDLAAQLAEFDLRCAAGDYDTAAYVLSDLDYEYLQVWGHYRLLISYYEGLQGKLVTSNLRIRCLNELGIAYRKTGNLQRCINYYEKALAIAQEEKDKDYEGVILNNLAIFEYSFGNSKKSIEHLEKALILAREMHNLQGEANRLSNMGIALNSIQDYQKAKDVFQQALQVADGILFPTVQLEGRWGLAQSHLFQNDLVNARATIAAALQYDVPQYNHDATALHGIIALRQGDVSAAQQSFARAIAQADEILAKTPEYYSALDAKGLALSGLTICDLRLKKDDGQSSIVYRQQAIETFQQARKIAPHAGVVKSVLRLFDELVKCDTDGILKDVRNAVEGK